jgi:hypothetical protein
MSVSAPGRRARARNATFSLHPEALRAIDDLMAAGRAPSKNALVEGLVLREWRRLAQERRDAARLHAYQEAMHDPLFLADLGEVERAFATADAETARLIE